MTTTYSVEEVTPAVAASYLELVPPHQRSLSEHMVKKYARLMLEGKWVGATPEPLAFDTNNHLVQGQHRLQAVIRSGVTIRFTVARGVDAEVFPVLDSGMVRGAGQMLGTDGFIKAGAVRVIRSITGASPLANGVGRDAFCSNAEVMSSYFDDWQPEIDSLLGAVRKTSTATKVPGSALLAVMAVASRTQHADMIEEFLDGVLTGAGLSATDPRLHLRNRFIRGGATTAADKTGSVLKAWNAYVKGTPMQMLRFGRTDTMPCVAGYSRLRLAA